MRTLQGRLRADGLRVGVVAARFNQRVVDPLLAGAIDCLRRHGVEDDHLVVLRVPGAWELPLALQELAASGTVDALVALAVVIRGETPHFDYVCAECSKGVAAVSSQHRLPIGFGVLTTDTSAQAVERAGGKAGNKGWEAAQAALEMADLVAEVRQLGDGGDPAATS